MKRMKFIHNGIEVSPVFRNIGGHKQKKYSPWYVRYCCLEKEWFDIERCRTENGEFLQKFYLDNPIKSWYGIFRRLGKGINQMLDNRQCLECGQYFHYDEILGDVCIHCFESGDENDDKISK